MTVLAIWIVLVVSGYAHMRLLEHDDFKVGAVVLFGVYSWDFFSDIFFATNLLSQDPVEGVSRHVLVALFVASAVFIVVPLAKNFWDLLKAHDRWLESPVMSGPYGRWLSHNGTKLYVLSLLCGSTFSAVELLNSNLFGMSLFEMGLNHQDLRRFNRNRMWSVVLLENLPQLLLQLIYAGFVEKELGAVSLTAFLSSALSIAVAALDFISTGKVMKMEHSECIFTVKVTSSEPGFQQQRKRLRHRTKALALAIFDIFEGSVSSVEILPVRPSAKGLVLDILVSSSSLTESAIQSKLEEDGMESLKSEIASKWDLNEDTMTLERAERRLSRPQRSTDMLRSEGAGGRTMIVPEGGESPFLCLIIHLKCH